jgi:putative addiction module killer protein
MTYDVETTADYDAWLDGLRDDRARKAVNRGVVRMSGGLFGNVESVGDGVSELKIDVGAGYRAYFTIRGRKLIVLLCGGDKSSQRRDIKKAKEMAADLD